MRGMEGRPGCEYRLACWVGVVAEDLDAQQRFYHDVLGLAELALHELYRAHLQGS